MVVISLALGAAGGYGYFRFSAPDDTARIDALRVERDRLGKQVESQAAELEQLNTRLTVAGANDALIKQQQDSIATLRRQLEQAASGGDEAAIATRRQLLAEISAIEDARNQAAAESSTLKDRLAQVDTQLSNLRNQLDSAVSGRDQAVAEKTRVAQELARFEQEAADRQAGLTRDLDQIRQEAVPKLQDAVEQKQAALLLQQAEVERLKTALAQAQAAAQETAQALQARLEASAQQIAALAAAAKTAAADKTALEAEIANLAQQLADRAVTAPAVIDSKPVTRSEPTLPNQPGEPRDAFFVEQVMGRTPGLDRLSDLDRLRLEKRLIAGECVTNSLASVFDRVPVISLRNLIRDLKSSC